MLVKSKDLFYAGMFCYYKTGTVYGGEHLISIEYNVCIASFDITVNPITDVGQKGCREPLD